MRALDEVALWVEGTERPSNGDWSIVAADSRTEALSPLVERVVLTVALPGEPPPGSFFIRLALEHSAQPP